MQLPLGGGGAVWSSLVNREAPSPHREGASRPHVRE
jgi:hypothetical protein